MNGYKLWWFGSSQQMAATCDQEHDVPLAVTRTKCLSHIQHTRAMTVKKKDEEDEEDDEGKRAKRRCRRHRCDHLRSIGNQASKERFKEPYRKGSSV